MEVPKQQEVVTIEKSVLEGLMKQLEQNKEIQKKLEMLEYAADKGRIARWESNNTGLKEKKVSLHHKEGKIVTSWRVVKDDIIRDPATNVQTGEYQEMEIVFQDGTKEKIVGYGNFSNFMYSNEMLVNVLAETRESDGTVTFKVGVPSGEQLLINSRFVN